MLLFGWGNWRNNKNSTSAYVLLVSNGPMIFGLPFIKQHASFLAHAGVWSILGCNNAVHPHEESSSKAVQINLILVYKLRIEVKNHEKMEPYRVKAEPDTLEF